MEAPVPKSEKRRAPRIPAELLVMIEGLHDDYGLAVGNISSSGVLLELPSAPGRPGDLELLHLATTDHQHRVAVMAQIVRCVTIDTLGATRPMVAVVFEFLPERREVRSSLTQLIQYVLRQNQVRETFSLDHRLPVELELPDEATPHVTPKAATVFRLEIKRMILETTWPISLGDRVNLSFRCGRMKLPFEGQVASCSPRHGQNPPLYDIEVSVGEMMATGPQPSLTSFSESVDLVLTEIVGAEPTDPEHPQRHLAGRLDRIPLPSLLTFLEMERQSGRLVLGDEDGITLFFDEGRVVDILPFSHTPLEQLDLLLEKQDERFTFTVEPVDRPDRVQMETTHVLLEWARRRDERDKS